MKHIIKNTTPAEFREWKRNESRRTGQTATFARLDKCIDIKNIVKSNLLTEQYFMCCYCCIRINTADSHIEHLKPQSTNRNLQTNYANLLASCSGQDLHLHCGFKKDNWYNNLMVSPLNPNCEDYFRYGLDGTIYPSNDPTKVLMARTTIEELGLDTDSLNARRKEAISLIYEEDLSAEEVEELIEYYQTPDDDGRLPAFTPTLIYILKGELVYLR